MIDKLADFTHWDPENDTVTTEGATKLKAWLEANDVSQREFARITGLQLARINRFIKGRSRPSLREAVTIREHCPEIDCADWF